jgi:eukaryotic-like serine/threonine-protein kinase
MSGEPWQDRDGDWEGAALAWDRIQSIAPGRFSAAEVLGRGASGTVFAAFDSVRGEEVAIKWLHAPSSAAIAQLKREFRAASHVSHPNLVLLYDLLSDGAEWCFTMQKVAGQPLARGPLSAEALLSMGRQLASAIQALHSAGHLHRDVKPSNILVDDDGHVTLLDFGLALSVEQGSVGAWATLAGSPAYLAPEQLRPQSALTPACDWYAFGTILYELMSGELPFGGAPERLLIRKLTEDAPRLTNTPPGLSPEVIAVCQDLLERDPRLRPETAKILKVFGVDDESSYPEVAPAARSESRVLVGRDDTLRMVEGWLFGGADRPRSTLLVGPSGIGKTTLAHALVKGARARGALVLTSRCYREESVPFNAWDPAVDELARQFVDNPELAPSWIDPALLRVFSGLRNEEHSDEFLAESVSFCGDLSEVRLAAVRALGGLLHGLCYGRELLIFFDDFHWADRDSVRLLRDMLVAHDAPPIRVVATARTEDLSGSHLEELLVDGQFEQLNYVLPVGPLSSEACRQILSQERNLARAVREKLVTESRGSPFLLRELVRDLSLPGTRRASSPSVRALVESRMLRVSEHARILLETLAVFRRPLEQRIAARALALPGGASEEVERLRALGLVRMRVQGEEALLEIYHDCILDAVLENTAETVVRGHLSAIGDAFVAILPHAHESIAYCFARAGRTSEAAGYAAQLAAEFEKSLAFASAARWYRSAIEWSTGTDAERLRLLRRLGEAAQAAGDGELAGSAFGDAARLVAEVVPHEKHLFAELRRREAHSYLLSGCREAGETVLALVLQEARCPTPAANWRHVLRLVWGRLKVFGTRLRWRKKPLRDGDLEQLLALDLATVSWITLDPVRAWDYATAHLCAALKWNDPGQLLGAVSSELICHSFVRPSERQWTERLLALGEDAARLVKDERSLAWWDIARCTVGLLTGKWEQADAFAQQAEARLLQKCQGVYWELETTRRARIAARQMHGFMTSHDAEQREWLAEAVARKDRLGEAVHLIGLAFSACLRDDEREVQHLTVRVRELTANLDTDLQIQGSWLNSLAVAYFNNEPAELIAARNSLRRFWSTPHRFVPLYRSVTFNYEVILSGRLAILATTDEERAPWLAELVRLERCLRKESFPTAEGHAWQAAARRACASGRTAESARACEAAADAFFRAGMLLEGEVERALGCSLAGDLEGLAVSMEKMRLELGVVAPLCAIAAYSGMPRDRLATLGLRSQGGGANSEIRTRRLGRALVEGARKLRG